MTSGCPHDAMAGGISCDVPQAAVHVFVLSRNAADWIQIEPALWLQHLRQGSPLVGNSGEVHVAETIVSRGEIINLCTSYRRLDAGGRLLLLLDELPPDEKNERDRLMVDVNIDEIGQRRYDALRRKEWRASLPSAHDMRRLIDHLTLPLSFDGGMRALFKEIGLDPDAWVEEKPGRPQGNPTP